MHFENNLRKLAVVMELLSWNYFYENIKIFCNLVHLLKLNEINILKEKG